MRHDAPLPPDFLKQVARPGTENAPIQHLDVRDDIPVVLAAIDRLLEPHGLEVVRYDTPDDEFMFSVAARREKAA